MKSLSFKKKEEAPVPAASTSMFSFKKKEEAPADAAPSSSSMFSFRKKEQQPAAASSSPPPPPAPMIKTFSFMNKNSNEVEVEALPPPNPPAAVPSTPPKITRSLPPVQETTVANTASSKKKKFGFGNNKSKRMSDRGVAVDAPTVVSTPSPKSRSRQQNVQQQQQFGNEDEDSDDDDEVYQTKSSRSRGGCCTCRRLLLTSCCSILLLIVGLVTWRYGPWAKDSATVSSLEIDPSDGCGDFDCCNGLASNCDLALNEVLFPMVQKAHSSYDNNFAIASNTKPFEEALVAGYRALQLSTCLCEGILSKLLLERDAEWGLGDSNLGFCETSCGAGVRDPKDVLTNLRTFLETNPREVLIIELEMNDGSSSDLRKALQYSGLLEYVWRPQDEYYIEEWPTLQELINDNNRLILFGSGDGMKSCPANDCDDGILYTFDHFSQTNTDGSDLESCDATLVGDVRVGYFKMNHFAANSKMNIPSAKQARDLNSYSKLEERFDTCVGKRAPNLLAVEFWDEGKVLHFVKNENSGKNRNSGEYAKSDTAEDGTSEEDAGQGNSNGEQESQPSSSIQGMGFGRRGLRG